jgi:hypothetical protein
VALDGLRTLARMARAEIVLQEASLRADARLQRLARRPGRLVVGPWISEIGFEVLYWIPLLRALLRRHGVAPERVTAITRGGAGVWYGDIAAQTVDVFEHIAPDELRAELVERARSGALKQLTTGALERKLLAAAGAEGTTVIAPSLMYALFAPLWARRRPYTLLERKVAFAPLAAAPKDDYIAVKAYWSAAFPDTRRNRDALDDVVAALARRHPVLAIDSGGRYDEHADWTAPDLPGVTRLSPSDPVTNLRVQSDAIAKARALVTVHGGFAHLGPFLGTRTLALHSTTGWVQAHEDAARRAVRALPGASLATLDVDQALEWLEDFGVTAREPAR